LKLNGTLHILVYADDVNILGGSVRTINKNTEALIVASKEIGLELNVVRPRRRWEGNNTMDLQEVECADMDCIELAQDRDRLLALVNVLMNLRVPEIRGIS
jgi:hypothetical protein